MSNISWKSSIIPHFPILFQVLLAFCLCFLSGCLPKLEGPEPNTGSASIKSPVFLGGSHMAGFRDWALFDEGQASSVAELLANQFSLASGASLNGNWRMGSSQGLAVNSKPWESKFHSRGHLGAKTDCEGVVSTSVLRDTFGLATATSLLAPLGVQARNLAIPYATTSDWLKADLGKPLSSGGKNPYFPRICTNPGTATVVDDAMALNPDFFTMWPGLEEILMYAKKGATTNPPLEWGDFKNKLVTILNRLTVGGAKGAIATLPNLDHFPFFTTVPPLGLDISASLADSLNDIYANLPIEFHEGPNGFIIKDVNAVAQIRLISENEHILLDVPTDSMKCYYMGILFSVIPDRYILDDEEILEIDLAIANYNAVIREMAETYDLALVDINGLFTDIHDGYIQDGVSYSTLFVSGGFFSTDALHPTPKGNGIIANSFIKAINNHFGAAIPTVNVSGLEGIIFP